MAVATFEDQEVLLAQVYEQRKNQSQGLHFLLVQPDDLGMTYSGFWPAAGLIVSNKLFLFLLVI